jgi:hypothetical protein
MMRSGASEQLLGHLARSDTLRLRNVQGMSDGAGKLTWSEWIEAEKRPTLPPGWSPAAAVAAGAIAGAGSRRTTSVSIKPKEQPQEWSGERARHQADLRLPPAEQPFCVCVLPRQPDPRVPRPPP